MRAAASSLCFVTLQADNVIEALQSAAALSELQGDVNAITRLAMAMEAVIALQRLAPREPAAEASSIATPDNAPALAELLLNSPEVPWLALGPALGCLALRPLLRSASR